LAAFGKYKWLVAVVSVLLTCGPVLWFTFWLQKQGQAEVSIAANWSIRIAELMIDQAVTRFHELDARGIRSCGVSDVEILQRTSFASDSITELAVVDRNGQTLCTDHGNVFVARDIIVTAATSNSEIMLDVVRTAESNERLLRVRRLASPGRPSLSALLRASQLLPRVAPDGAPFSGYARMTLADGTLVGTSGVEPTENDQRIDQIIGRTKSERYGPIVTVAMVRSGVLADYDDLRRIGMVVTGMSALLLLTCALVIPWRQSRNPISEIKDALISDEFVPYYQPIIDISSGKLLGAEVLVRWRKSNGTIVAPGGFIALIESSELVLDLTRSLMRQVCTEVGSTLGTRPQIYIAFNIAPLHFRDAAIINDVGSIFEPSPIGLSQIVLELTERYEIEDRGAARRVIAALQGLGCRISLDDVGTGRNGLSYIHKLGVDIIKVDKMFVDAIATDPQSQAIVATLVGLSHDLQMQLVAEGVETFEQITYLREHGVHAAQGYVFAPPLPGSAFLELVKAIDPLPSKIVADNLGEASQNIRLAVSRAA
jgi:sensor c-di-GMP phosphodiesterase-like protein